MSVDIVRQANPADEVVPGLWLGSRYAALDPGYLKEKKIGAVFNCTKDIPFEPTIRRQYRVPVDDNLQEAEIRNLERQLQLLQSIECSTISKAYLINCYSH